MGFLVDSNVLIDYVAERFTPAQLSKLDDLFDQELNISVITRIETLGFNASTEEEQKMQLFFKAAKVMGLSEEVVVKTIVLRRTTKLKTPDAIIAATALVHDYTLLSRNLSDFSKVPDLKILNPHDW